MNCPDIIPPGSVVRLVASDETTGAWRGREGERFRIGYYVPNDGLGVIWLVNASGEYCETVDRESLIRFFEIEQLSDETDLFGVDKRAPE
jgi:hypothetical protein